MQNQSVATEQKKQTSALRYKAIGLLARREQSQSIRDYS